MIERTRLTLIVFALIAFSFSVSAQTETVNVQGKYAFKALTGWRVKLTGSDSFVYAPADGAMDPWDEKLSFGITDGEGIELEDAFDFYINTDFPAAYGGFNVIGQGEETVNGLTAKWATFTFSAQGTAAGAGDDSTLSAGLQAVFYLFKQNNTLYLVNGVTEKNLYPTFDTPFRTIIRTFRVTE